MAIDGAVSGSLPENRWLFDSFAVFGSSKKMDGSQRMPLAPSEV